MDRRQALAYLTNLAGLAGAAVGGVVGCGATPRPIARTPKKTKKVPRKHDEGPLVHVDETEDEFVDELTEADVAPAEVEFLDWSFPSEGFSERRAVIMVPKPLPRDAALPVLVALHGLGETTDANTGAWGWVKSYGLDKTYLRLHHPRLSGDAFSNFVTPERLDEINESLEDEPFQGMIVACPYLPREIGGYVTYEAYAKWLDEKLLSRIRNQLPVDPRAEATGIDGVSLGGLTSIRIGLLRPDVFGVIGALQPAVDGMLVDFTLALIEQKLEGRPFRIVTSSEDVYRLALQALDQKMTAKKLDHEFIVTPGPHDYPWNRGAGGIEMLLFHDRALRLG